MDNWITTPWKISGRDFMAMKSWGKVKIPSGYLT
jgi:hypothetical protein